MKTSKKTSKNSAKKQIQIRDLKPTKDAKGGSGYDLKPGKLG
jgi:hypothetical protein